MPDLPRSRAWLLLATTLVLQLILLRTATVLKPNVAEDLEGGGLLRRSEQPVDRTLLYFPYSTWYDTSSPTAKPFVFLALLFILTFLFSFIGISASDFFCPNLSTIATYLGLNESTAGVTFLAFGNGSPDVFSTFAALRRGTFGLAIGELIGAASFIVSIVVGSIALIRPFLVPRHAFLRDVLFFTAAVFVLIAVLYDGRLTLTESGCMVGLYAAYVSVVMAGNWWGRRRRDKEASRALGWDIGSNPSGQHAADTPDNQSRPLETFPALSLPPPSLRPSGQPRSASTIAQHTTSPTVLSPTSSPGRPQASRATTHALSVLSPLLEEHNYDTPRANFSLLRAVEFRDVVNSLRREGSPTVSPSRTPAAGVDSQGDYFGHYNRHRRSSSHDPALNTKLSSPNGRPTAKRLRSATHSQQIIQPFAPGTEVRSSSTPRAGTPQTSSTSDSNPWTTQQGNPFHPLRTGISNSSPGQPGRPRLYIPSEANQSYSSIPVISVTDPSGAAASSLATTTASRSSPDSSPSASESRFRIRHRSKIVLRVLFPSLQSFRHKSYLGMTLAVVSVPAIIALTLTLPVVDDGRPEEGGIALPAGESEPLNTAYDHDVESGHSDIHQEDDDRELGPVVGEALHHLVEESGSPLNERFDWRHRSAHRRPSVEDARSDRNDQEDELCGQEITKEIMEEMRNEDSLEFSRVLTAAQCVLGPAFCCVIIFQETSFFVWVLLGCFVAGICGAAAVLYGAEDGSSRPWKLFRCFAGFICSMVWIAAIADEVVSVLRAVGEILGLSDAIIGLTIFAVGNSLADLVANVTVAQFAPAMAYAACFGGPMLNLLLGVGGSGTYHMLASPSHAPVAIHFSPTLAVSACGLVLMLVATAIFVPLNGYLVDRRWACCLIVAYLAVMTANVAVEVKTGRT